MIAPQASQQASTTLDHLDLTLRLLAILSERLANVWAPDTPDTLDTDSQMERLWKSWLSSGGRFG